MRSEEKEEEVSLGGTVVVVSRSLCRLYAL